MRLGGRPQKTEPPRPSVLARVSSDTKRKLSRLAREWEVPFAGALDRVALANIDREYEREFAGRVKTGGGK